jgi:toxin YoeB
VKLIFSERAWEDYLYWQRSDKKILRRINRLIKEISKHSVNPSALAANGG